MVALRSSPPQEHAILWRRLDKPGHDACRIAKSDLGWDIQGAAVFMNDGGPAWLQYSLRFDNFWVTRAGRVIGWTGSFGLDLVIYRADDGKWTVNGDLVQGVDGIGDLDLGFTPATNTNAIRRMALGLGDRATTVAVWLDTADWTFKQLPQTYNRIANDRYQYCSPTHNYHAELRVDAFGCVVEYPSLWSSV
jgi:hypothetical protein